MIDIDDRLGELVRDACSITPVPKSEYRHRLKQLLADVVAEITPEKITAGSIDHLMPANYRKDDNADTQKGFNRAIDQIQANATKLLGDNHE